MPSIMFEKTELSMLIGLVEGVIHEQDCTLCGPVWGEILAKLKKAEKPISKARKIRQSLAQEQPPPSAPQLEVNPVKQSAQAKPWSPEEDEVLRKYAGTGKTARAAIRAELPDRTNSMIKSRLVRLTRPGATTAPLITPTTEPTSIPTIEARPSAPAQETPESGWGWVNNPPKDKLMAGR